jgi:hypothetical protein
LSKEEEAEEEKEGALSHTLRVERVAVAVLGIEVGAIRRHLHSIGVIELHVVGQAAPYTEGEKREEKRLTQVAKMNNNENAPSTYIYTQKHNQS